MTLVNTSSRARQARRTAGTSLQMSIAQMPAKVALTMVNTTKQVPDDSHPMTKSVVAMSNPNWRKRRAYGSSTSSSTDTATCIITNSHDKKWSGSDCPSPTLRVDTCKDGTMLRPTENTHWPEPKPADRMAQNVGKRQCVPLTRSENSEQSTSSEKDGYGSWYEVTKKIDLAPVLGPEHCISVIEVTPLGLSHNQEDSNYALSDFSTSDMVEIRSFKPVSRLSSMKSENSQTQQLNAALEAAETTPRKGRLSLAPLSNVDKLESIENHQKNSIGNFGREYPPNESITAMKNMRHELSSNSSATSFNHSLGGTCEDQNESTRKKIKDEGFQRMLQKLGRNACPGQKHQSLMKNEVRDNEGRQNSGPPENFRHPHRGNGRREATVSDFCIGYMPKTRESTTDSGFSVDEQVKFNTLNPRAREFLSFTQRQDSEPERENQALFQTPFPVCPPEAPIGQASGTVDGHLPSFPLLGSNPLPYEPISSSSPSPPSYGFNGIVPINIGSVLAANALALGLNQLQGLGSTPALLTTPPEGLGHQPVLQPIASNMLALQPTPLTSSALALNNNADLGRVGPVCQFGSAVVAPGQPPVPKPRIPNPKNQQAYEAWIEWRKANEPGYAMECKLRQQRRAQRHLPTKPKHQSGQMLEVTAPA